VNDAFEVFNLHDVNLAWRRFSRKRGVIPIAVDQL
jgi:hypothetical protein